jgi:hypothetical protein
MGIWPAVGQMPIIPKSRGIPMPLSPFANRNAFGFICQPFIRGLENHRREKATEPASLTVFGKPVPSVFFVQMVGWLDPIAELFNN